MAKKKKRSVAEKKILPVTAALAEKEIAALPPGSVALDPTVANLRFVISPTGVRAWKLRMKLDGEWKRKTLHGVQGVEEARKAAEALLAQVRTDKEFGRYFTHDPRAASRQEDSPSILQTFDLAVKVRLEEREVVKERTMRGYRAAILALGPEFYDRPLASVTAGELDVFADDFREKNPSPSYYGNWRAALTMTWEYAKKRCARTGGLEYYGVDVNLTLTLKGKQFDMVEPPQRERDFLSWETKRVFWRWLTDPRCPFTPTQKRIYKVFLFLGERPKALLLGKWADMSWETGWWIIHPQDRKTRATKVQNTAPLYIYLSQTLREILGEPTPIFGAEGETPNTYPWVFPAEREPFEPYAQGSLPIWDAFRAREMGARKNLTPREGRYQRRYAKFPIPDEIEPFNHYEAGRHSLSTNAQAAGIPGLYVSLMLGHTVDTDLPGAEEARRFMAERGVKGLSRDMSRALKRQALAASGASKMTKKHYTHLDHLPGLRIAWLLWAQEFCEQMGLPFPQKDRAALEEAKSPEDRILDLVHEQFGGDLHAALKVLSGAPALRVVPSLSSPDRNAQE
jgi:integrase